MRSMSGWQRIGVMRYFVTAVIAASALSYGTTADAQEKVIFTTGLANNSCGKYLAAVHGHPPGKSMVADLPQGQFHDDHHRYIEWLRGFLTATDLLVMDGPNQLKVDDAAIDVWIRKWCEQNPTKPLFQAAMAFVRDQRKDYLEAWFAGQQAR